MQDDLIVIWKPLERFRGVSIYLYQKQLMAEFNHLNAIPLFQYPNSMTEQEEENYTQRQHLVQT